MSARRARLAVLAVPLILALAPAARAATVTVQGTLAGAAGSTMEVVGRDGVAVSQRVPASTATRSCSSPSASP